MILPWNSAVSVLKYKSLYINGILSVSEILPADWARVGFLRGRHINCRRHGHLWLKQSVVHFTQSRRKETTMVIWSKFSGPLARGNQDLQNQQWVYCHNNKETWRSFSTISASVSPSAHTIKKWFSVTSCFELQSKVYVSS